MNTKMNRLYMVELTKLMVGLMERNIGFTFTPFMNGGKVELEDCSWDAICHDGSYGHNEGLLEIMGSIVQNEYDSVEGYLTAVEGYLTADEILKRLNKEG